MNTVYQSNTGSKKSCMDTQQGRYVPTLLFSETPRSREKIIKRDCYLIIKNFISFYLNRKYFTDLSSTLPLYQGYNTLRISLSLVILANMTTFKLQYLIILSIYLYSRFSYGLPYELLYNGAQIVTYGEPCYPTRYLSGKIEV